MENFYSFPRIRGGDPENGEPILYDYQLFPAYAGVIPSDGPLCVVR